MPCLCGCGVVSAVCVYDATLCLFFSSLLLTVQPRLSLSLPKYDILDKRRSQTEGRTFFVFGAGAKNAADLHANDTSNNRWPPPFSVYSSSLKKHEQTLLCEGVYCSAIG